MLPLLGACAPPVASTGLILDADGATVHLDAVDVSLFAAPGPVATGACPGVSLCQIRASARWTEWWRPLPRGWEQGFTVYEGGDHVTIPVTVTGATPVAAGPRAARLVAADATLLYTGLQAWDADQQELPAAGTARSPAPSPCAARTRRCATSGCSCPIS